MPRFTCALAIAASLAVAACSDRVSTPTSPRLGPALAALASATTSTTNVTSTVYDKDGLGNSLLTRSDDYNGTGFATYTTINKISSVIISGFWQLYLGNQTARTLYLVLASQGIPAPDGYYSSNVEAYSKCFDQNNNQVSILNMATGASNGNCSFGVDFSSGQTKYKLAMSPIYSGTGRALVTCNAVAGRYCTRWTIVPNAGVTNAGVANLYTYAKNGALVLVGAFRNSYSVAATE